MPQTSLTFEAASIHPAAANQLVRDQIEESPIRLVIKNASMGQIVRWAFRLNNFQLEGPSWIADERYDISASCEKPTSSDQKRAMFRTLMGDRFGLSVHQEKRSVPGFVLEVSKDGPKFKQSDEPGEAHARPGRILVWDHASMAQLADFLSNPMRSPVEDRTNLTSAYDFKLDINQVAMIDPSSDNPVEDMPSRFAAAVRQQLGLILRRQRIDLEVTVIDRIAKTPAAN